MIDGQHSDARPLALAVGNQMQEGEAIGSAGNGERHMPVAFEQGQDAGSLSACDRRYHQQPSLLRSLRA